jgi:hypothetical protein
MGVARRLRTARDRDETSPVDRPADVGFMLAIHAAFRRDLERLDRWWGAGRPTSSGVHEGFQLFRRELESHHLAEDEDLWPILRSRLQDPADRATVDAMYDEHSRLPRVLDAVDVAVAIGGGRDVVDDLTGAVLHHLDHEEQAVLPLITKHLSALEWRRFLLAERRRHQLRRRSEFLMWVLDDATAGDAEPVMRELPAPARFVYRAVLRRMHRRRHLWPSHLAPAVA